MIRSRRPLPRASEAGVFAACSGTRLKCFLNHNSSMCHRSVPMRKFILSARDSTREKSFTWPSKTIFKGRRTALLVILSHPYSPVIERKMLPMSLREPRPSSFRSGNFFSEPSFFSTQAQEIVATSVHCPTGQG
jgi:hypothetical protein